MPNENPDAPRAGGETPAIDVEATLSVLRIVEYDLRHRDEAPEPNATSNEIHAEFAQTLATLRTALPSLLERHRDGERWRGLVALLDRESMRTPEPGTLILWTMRSNQWDAPIASIQSVASRAPARTLWIEEAETINEAMDRVLPSPSTERASK